MGAPEPYYQDEFCTIYLGDCRDILPSLADNSIDFVFTDPPYGHNNNNGDLAHRIEFALGKIPSDCSESERPPARPIANDGPEANELVQFAFSEFKRLLKPGCCCCCCGGGGGPDPQFAKWSLWLDAVSPFKQMVVWDKGGLGLGWHYRRNYEVILIGEKPGAACRWFGGSDTPNIVRINKIIPQANDHPTPKPVELVKWFLDKHTQPGDIVLDPFNGSGSTARACKDLGRKYIGIEIDERWLKMTVDRLSQYALPLWGAV